MADYVWGIGGGAEMMIRDQGIGSGNVEFWFHAGPYTWNNQQGWGYDAGWGFQHGIFKLSTGGGWHHLGTINVPTSRNVMMRIDDSGLAFPGADRTAYIGRATVPGAPYFVDVRATGASSVHTQFYGNGDGGTPVREWQLAYGTNPNGASYYIGSNGVNDVGGLAGGTWWYFWARGRNDVGWSGWSGRVQAFTWRVPDAPSPVTFDLITQTSLRTRFSGGFDGGEPVDQWQLAYGLSSNVANATLVTSSGTYSLSNLSPGETYYFWARGRNAVGWGPWSSVRAQTLRAGGMVKDDGIWKRALPYVKVNGIWRLSESHVKQAGVWKEIA